MSNIEITDRPCIVVATNGHVWVAKSIKQDSAWLHCTDARIIDTWGTTKGLNELVGGPTKETRMDMPAPVVSIANIALIASRLSRVTMFQVKATRSRQ